MPSATSSSLGTSANYHAEQSPSQLPIKNDLCLPCEKSHVTSSPPISFDVLDTQIQEKIENTSASTHSRSNSSSSSSTDDERVSTKENEQSPSPFQCLFCSKSFQSSDTGFATNLAHMRTAHGLFIPDPELVMDLQTFVAYLATEVRTWHECLYCGATRSSAQSVQSHMQDKGHCLLNLEREPELLGFWDEDGAITPEQETPTDISETEIGLPSSRVIGSRHAVSAIEKERRKQNLAASTRDLPLASEDEDRSVRPQLVSGRQLALRNKMSLLGVSLQQRQALSVAEKMAQRSDTVACRAREWVYAKGGNMQKFDQIDVKMKWGKQNHKLLPR